MSQTNVVLSTSPSHSPVNVMIGSTMEINHAEDDPSLKRLRTFGRSLIKRSTQPVTDLTEFQQSALRGTFKLTELRTSRSQQDANLLFSVSGNNKANNNRNVSVSNYSQRRLQQMPSARDTHTPVSELKNSGKQKTPRMVEFVSNNSNNNVHCTSHAEAKRTRPTVSIHYPDTKTVDRQTYLHELPLLVNVRDSNEINNTNGSFHSICCNSSSGSSNNSSVLLSDDNVNYKQPKRMEQPRSERQNGNIVNEYHYPRTHFVQREFTEAEMRRTPSLRNLSVIRSRVEMARDVMAQSVESAPFPHVRTTEERLEEVLHDEHAKILLLTGRVHNLQEHAEEIVDAIAHAKEDGKTQDSVAPSALSSGKQTLNKQILREEKDERKENKHEELIKFLAPVEASQRSLSRASSMSSLTPQVISPEDAVRQVRQLVHNFLTASRRGKRELHKHKNHHKDKYHTRRKLDYNGLLESETDPFAISRLRTLIEQFDENINVLEEHHGKTVNDGTSAKRREELLTREPNAKDIGWILETLDMALLTDIHTLVNADNKTTTAAAATTTTTTDNNNNNKINNIAQDTGVSTDKNINIEKNTHDKCPLPFFVSSITAASSPAANREEIRRMLKERLKLSRTRRALSVREFAHSTLSSSWNSTASQRLETTQSSGASHVAEHTLHKSRNKNAAKQTNVSNEMDDSLVPFSYHSFPSGNSCGLEGELGNLNMVNFMFEAMVDELLRQQQKERVERWKDERVTSTSRRGSESHLQHSYRSKSNSRIVEKHQHKEQTGIRGKDKTKSTLRNSNGIQENTKRLHHHHHNHHHRHRHHHHRQASNQKSNKNNNDENSRAVSAPVNSVESEQLPESFYDLRKWMNPSTHSKGELQGESEEQEEHREEFLKGKKSSYRYADAESSSPSIDEFFSSASSSRMFSSSVSSSSSTTSTSTSPSESLLQNSNVLDEEGNILMHVNSVNNNKSNNKYVNGVVDGNGKQKGYYSDNVGVATPDSHRLRVVSLCDSYLNKLRNMYKLYDYHQMINEHREQVHLSHERTESDYIAEMEAKVAKHREQSAKAASRQRGSSSTNDWQYGSNVNEDDILNIPINQLRKRLSSQDRPMTRSSTSSQYTHSGRLPPSRSSQRSQTSITSPHRVDDAANDDKPNLEIRNEAEDDSEMVIFTKEFSCGVIFTLTVMKDAAEVLPATLLNKKQSALIGTINNKSSNEKDKAVPTTTKTTTITTITNNNDNNNRKQRNSVNSNTMEINEVSHRFASASSATATATTASQHETQYILRVTNNNHDKSCIASVSWNIRNLPQGVEVNVNRNWTVKELTHKEHVSREEEEQQQREENDDDDAKIYDKFIELEISPHSAIELLTLTVNDTLTIKQKQQEQEQQQKQRKEEKMKFLFKNTFTFTAKEIAGFDAFNSLNPLDRKQSDVISLTSNDDDNDDVEGGKGLLSAEIEIKKKRAAKKRTKKASPTRMTTNKTGKGKAMMERKHDATQRGKKSISDMLQELRHTDITKEKKEGVDKLDVDAWGAVPTEPHTDVIEKNIIALSALRMSVTEPISTTTTTTTPTTTPTTAANVTNVIDTLHLNNNNTNNNINKNKEHSPDTVADWMTATYSSVLPRAVDNTFVFDDTNKPYKNNITESDIDGHNNNNNNSQIELEQSAESLMPLHNGSALDKRGHDRRVSNMSYSKTFHLDTAPGSREDSLQEAPEDDDTNTVAAAVADVAMERRPSWNEREVVNAPRTTSSPLPPLGSSFASNLSKLARPVSSHWSHSSRPTSATHRSSSPRLPTPPMIIASSSSHPLLTSQDANKIGSRDANVRYDVEDVDDSVNGNAASTTDDVNNGDDYVNVVESLSRLSSATVHSRPSSGRSDIVVVGTGKNNQKQISQDIIRQLELVERKRNKLQRNADDTNATLCGAKRDNNKKNDPMTSHNLNRIKTKPVTSTINTSIPLPAIVYDVDEEQVQLDTFVTMTLPQVCMKRSHETGKVNVLLPADVSVNDALRKLPLTANIHHSNSNNNIDHNNSNSKNKKGIGSPTSSNTTRTTAAPESFTTSKELLASSELFNVSLATAKANNGMENAHRSAVENVSAVQASTFLKKIAKDTSNNWHDGSQNSKLVSINNTRQNATISSRQFKSEMDQLEDEARELYLIDPVRYDAVIDDLLNFALERVNSATATTKKRSAVDADDQVVLENDNDDNDDVSAAVNSNAAVSWSIAKEKSEHEALEHDDVCMVQTEGGLLDAAEQGTISSARLLLPPPSFPLDKAKLTSRALTSTLNAEHETQECKFPTINRKSTTQHIKAPLRASVITLSQQTQLSKAHETPIITNDTQPLLPERSKRRSTVLMEKLEMTKEGESTSIHVLAEGKEEIERILYDQMKAKLILRFMLAQMKSLWAQKKRACDEKTRERTFVALRNTLRASWQVERKRVINLNKLIHILDRRSRRQCHGWIPLYTDDNVLVEVYANTENGTMDHQVCRRFTKLHAQRSILHAACLAKRRKLLPLHLLRREVQDHYNYHLLYGYRTQTIELSELVAPGQDVNTYRTYIEKSHSHLLLRHGHDMKEGQCQKSYTQPSLTYLLTPAERIRYRRRLQYTAAFQHISSKFSPRRRRDMDLPY